MTAPILTTYLDELERYTGKARVPGLDGAFEPVPLEQVFVEPYLETARSPSKEDPVRALDALKGHRHIAVVGEPGVGKTTLVYQFASHLAARTEVFGTPLLVELGRLRGSPLQSSAGYQWLHDGAPYGLQEALGETGWYEFDGLIRAGRTTLLLDGLDELDQLDQRWVAERIEKLKRTGNSVVLTSRPHAYQSNRLEGLHALRLKELDPVQATALARNLITVLATQFEVKDPSPALSVVLGVCKGRTGDLTRNPLFLSFICMTTIRQQSEGRLGDVAIDPVSIIRECVDALVAWHSQHRRGCEAWPAALNRAFVVEILATLALGSYRNESGLITQEELNAIGERSRDYLLKHLVPARFVERREVSYAFPLETFREYFAAYAIAHSADPYSQVRGHLHEPQWQRVIEFAVGILVQVHAAKLHLALPTLSRLTVKGLGPLTGVLASIVQVPGARVAQDELVKQLQSPLDRWLVRSCGSVEYFVKAILEHDAPFERILHRNLRLAARCLGTRRDGPPRVCRQVVDALVQAIRLDEDEGKFVKALAVAAHCREVWQAILPLAGDASAYKRSIAAQALGAAASQPQVREALLSMLQRGADGKASPGSWESFWVDQTRRWAAWSLAEDAVNPETYQPLLDLTHSADDDLMEWCVVSLQPAAGETPVAERLFQLLCGDEDAPYRRTAARVLGKAAALPEIRERLLELTHDPNPIVRRHVATALEGALAKPAAVNRLIEMARNEDPAVEKAALDSIYRMPGEIPLPVRSLLLDQVRHGDFGASIVLQKQARLKDVWQPMLALVRDGGDGTFVARDLAARVLRGAIADERVVAALVELTHKSAYDEVLIKRDPELADDKYGLIPSLERSERREVLTVLARPLGDAVHKPKVCDRLLALTYDDSDLIRGACAKALAGAARKEKVWPRLLELTHDEDKGVCKAAVSAVAGAVSETAVRQRLAALTHNGPEDIRETATAALRGAAGREEVQERLLALVLDDSAKVATAAAEALSGASRNITPDLLRRLAGLVDRQPRLWRTLDTLA